MNKDIRIEKVSDNDRQKNILFKLLNKRKYNISHSKIPDYKSHNYFVKNHPYREWFIVFSKEKEIGTFYIKFDNSIGLNLIIQKKENIEFILNFIKNNFSPLKEKSSLIPPYFYINVASNNFQMQAILEEMKINSLQVSYKI
tara:strand:- start:342 stop:767 length:426 start_codon:yes stop_codon:yes gene_type:complete